MMGAGVGMVAGLVSVVVAPRSQARSEVVIGRIAGIVVAAADSASFAAKEVTVATAGGVTAFPAGVATRLRGRSRRRTG
jgi:hypothetical protein